MFKQFLSGKKDSYTGIHTFTVTKALSGFLNLHKIWPSQSNCSLLIFIHFSPSAAEKEGAPFHHQKKKKKICHFVSGKHQNKSLLNPISSTCNMPPDKFLQEGEEINLLTCCSDGQFNWFGKPHTTAFIRLNATGRGLTAEGWGGPVPALTGKNLL